ncbi:MAG: hypothetical protein K2L56_07235, partial [Prevotella sp.]|nr:hypothetical protein [Prevotella sp.]
QWVRLEYRKVCIISGPFLLAVRASLVCNGAAFAFQRSHRCSSTVAPLQTKEALTARRPSDFSRKTERKLRISSISAEIMTFF